MAASMEFHAAALEIRHSPLPLAARATSWTVMLACAAAAAWAWLGWVDIVAVAEGKVVPAGRAKVVQPMEAGMVTAILVAEGDRVESGTVLMELDSTAPDVDAAQVEEQALALALEQARLRVLLEVAGGADFALPDVPGASAAQLHNLRERVDTELGAHSARLRALAEERRQREAEKTAAAARLRQMESTIPLVTERAAAREALVAAGLYPRTQWLELEEMRLVQLAQRDVERGAVATLDAALAGVGQRKLELEAGFRRELLAGLADVEPRLEAMRQETIRARQRQARHVLAAPVTGVVQRMAVRTVGGVVTPAQALMEIVPEGGDLELEAWVRNQDAGQVRVGQEVVVKVEAFPFMRHGMIAGTLLGISPDAIADEDGGLRYAARIGLGQSSFNVGGRDMPLAPGMVATVEVNLGRRRIADFLLGPLLRYRDEALREW